MEVEKGRRAHADSHIPGAHFLQLDEDLSGKKTGKNGRHPLPEIEASVQKWAASASTIVRVRLPTMMQAGLTRRGCRGATLAWPRSSIDLGWRHQSQWIAEGRAINRYQLSSLLC